MKIDRRALKESVSDVGVGILIAIPLSFAVLNVCTYLELANLTISICLLYTSPSPRDGLLSRMPSSA